MFKACLKGLQGQFNNTWFFFSLCGLVWCSDRLPFSASVTTIVHFTQSFFDDCTLLWYSDDAATAATNLYSTRIILRVHTSRSLRLAPEGTWKREEGINYHNAALWIRTSTLHKERYWTFSIHRLRLFITTYPIDFMRLQSLLADVKAPTTPHGDAPPALEADPWTMLANKATRTAEYLVKD
jgi:hypothetical protein